MQRSWKAARSPDGKNPAAVAFGRLGGLEEGMARSGEANRRAIAKKRNEGGQCPLASEKDAVATQALVAYVNQPKPPNVNARALSRRIGVVDACSVSALTIALASSMPGPWRASAAMYYYARFSRVRDRRRDP